FASLTPFGAALKRVLLKQSSQVAEPNSKPRFIPGLFIACGLSPGTTSQVIRFAHPFGAALKRVLLKQSSPGRGAKFKASVHTGAFYCLRTLTRDYVPGYSLRSPPSGPR